MQPPLRPSRGKSQHRPQSPPSRDRRAPSDEVPHGRKLTDHEGRGEDHQASPPELETLMPGLLKTNHDRHTKNAEDGTGIPGRSVHLTGDVRDTEKQQAHGENEEDD